MIDFILAIIISVILMLMIITEKNNLSGEYARKIGELEAKVYAYEKIIANSNCAFITQPPPGMDDDSDPYGINDFQAGHRRY